MSCLPALLKELDKQLDKCLEECNTAKADHSTWLKEAVQKNSSLLLYDTNPNLVCPRSHHKAKGGLKRSRLATVTEDLFEEKENPLSLSKQDPGHDRRGLGLRNTDAAGSNSNVVEVPVIKRNKSAASSEVKPNQSADTVTVEITRDQMKEISETASRHLASQPEVGVAATDEASNTAIRDLSTMAVPELKQELRNRGLSDSGKRNVLMKRLMAHIQHVPLSANTEEPEAAVPVKSTAGETTGTASPENLDLPMTDEADEASAPASDGSAEAKQSIEELNSMSHKELQKKLKHLGLPANGAKAVLVKRLFEHFQQQDAQVSEEAEAVNEEEDQPMQNQEAKLDKATPLLPEPDLLASSGKETHPDEADIKVAAIATAHEVDEHSEASTCHLGPPPSMPPPQLPIEDAGAVAPLSPIDGGSTCDRESLDSLSITDALQLDSSEIKSKVQEDESMQEQGTVETEATPVVNEGTDPGCDSTRASRSWPVDSLVQAHETAESETAPPTEAPVAGHEKNQNEPRQLKNVSKFMNPLKNMASKIMNFGSAPEELVPSTAAQPSQEAGPLANLPGSAIADRLQEALEKRVPKSNGNGAMEEDEPAPLPLCMTGDVSDTMTAASVQATDRSTEGTASNQDSGPSVVSGEGAGESRGDAPTVPHAQSNEASESSSKMRAPAPVRQRQTAPPNRSADLLKQQRSEAAEKARIKAEQVKKRKEAQEALAQQQLKEKQEQQERKQREREAEAERARREDAEKRKRERAEQEERKQALERQRVEAAEKRKREKAEQEERKQALEKERREEASEKLRKEKAELEEKKRLEWASTQAASAAAAASRAAAAQATKPLPEGWIEYKDTSGRAYYYHPLKKETTWSRPGLAPAAYSSNAASSSRATSHGSCASQQYPISESKATSDDESDEDEDDEEEQQQQKAKVPSWATNAMLQPQVINQSELDPDEIFGQQVHLQPEACDLIQIFGQNLPSRIHKRKSSGNWNLDKLSSDEERMYKRAMGFFR